MGKIIAITQLCLLHFLNDVCYDYIFNFRQIIRVGMCMNNNYTIYYLVSIYYVHIMANIYL